MGVRVRLPFGGTYGMNGPTQSVDENPVRRDGGK